MGELLNKQYVGGSFVISTRRVYKKSNWPFTTQSSLGFSQPEITMNFLTRIFFPNLFSGIQK
jgi:hypothetical protein